MIVDSSALIAILRGEHEAEVMSRAVVTSRRPAVSAATVLESSLVAGPTRQEALDEILAELGVEIVPFDAEQLAVARQAHLTYGRGQGSRARLNFGDCMSYALAKTRSEPLLYKGDDFVHTDIESAL